MPSTDQGPGAPRAPRKPQEPWKPQEPNVPRREGEPGQPQHPRDPQRRPQTADAGQVSLRDALPGEPYVMAGTSLDDRHAFRLEEMGLRRGTALTVLQRTNFGGRVVASGTQRIAIDGGTARSIFVIPCGGAADDAGDADDAHKGASGGARGAACGDKNGEEE